jgi:hypothetical protein
MFGLMNLIEAEFQRQKRLFPYRRDVMVLQIEVLILRLRLAWVSCQIWLYE